MYHVFVLAAQDTGVFAQQESPFRIPLYALNVKSLKMSRTKDYSMMACAKNNTSLHQTRRFSMK
jgi:hypothetical protein